MLTAQFFAKAQAPIVSIGQNGPAAAFNFSANDTLTREGRSPRVLMGVCVY